MSDLLLKFVMLISGFAEKTRNCGDSPIYGINILFGELFFN